MVAGRHTMGRWHATGRRASDGVGRHARVQVVRAVVVTHDGASDPLMWVGMHGSGLGAHGRGRRWGEGRAWVMDGMSALVGLCRHVCGVVVSNGPRHPCDARIMFCHLHGKADFVLCSIDVDGGLACMVMRPDLVGCGCLCTASGSPSLSSNETGPCMIRVAGARWWEGKVLEAGT